MSLEYFSTLTGIAVEILVFVIAFYGAYLVYLRQQRDKYREELVDEFQELDRIISQWSILESIPVSWHPPLGKYLQILERESWEKSPMETLKDILKKLDRTFDETRKKEKEFRTKAGGRLVAGPALYLEVKFALHNLVQTIYREFPPPPGDYKVSPPPGEIPFSVKSFVRYDFPDNRKLFLTWAKRYDIFFGDLYRIYYRIRPIIKTLKEVHIESIEQTKKAIIELEKIGRLHQWTRDALRESQEYSTAELDYYGQVFQFLGKMKHEIDGIKDKICTYDNYFYKDKRKTVATLLVMALTGIVIPLSVLFLKSEWQLETVKLISSVGFGLSTLLAILLIYQDISKF